MAIAAQIVWEVRTTGSATNGGGFKTGASGTDWSQQASAQYAVTDGVTAGTTTITSATANFGTDVVGNLIYVAGGTGSVTGDWYEITARTNSTTITVDRSTGLTAGTGVTLNIGGAVDSLQTIKAKIVSGNTVWIKATASYTHSSTCQIAALGQLWIFGYTTTRGDDGQVTILAGANSITVLAIASCAGAYGNIIVDNNSRSSVTALQINSGSGGDGQFVNCKAISAATGFSLAGGQIHSTTAFNCIADSCTSGFTLSGGAGIDSCRAKSCTTGVTMSGGQGGMVLSTLITGGTKGVVMGGAATAVAGGVRGCVITGTSSHGIDINAGGSLGQAGSIPISNTIIYGCGGYGINVSNVASGRDLLYAVVGRNAFGNNTSGDRNAYPTGTGDVSLSASPFTNSGSDDYSLNNTAGGGAACRAAGFPGALPGSSTTAYTDIGLQHQDSGGGGGGGYIWELASV